MVSPCAGNVSVTSSSVLRVSSCAVGASFLSWTPMVTVPTFELRVPSLARNVKLSVPLKSGAGV